MFVNCRPPESYSAFLFVGALNTYIYSYNRKLAAQPWSDITVSTSIFY